MKKWTTLVAFAMGAAAGAAVTWRFVKEKYEQIAREEIASVKETFSQRKIKKEANNASVPQPETKNDQENNNESYEDILTDNGYVDDRTKSYTNYTLNKYRKEKEENQVVPGDRPYVISPEEFDELADYNTISLTYYADGVLTDDMDEPIDPADIEDLVCEDFSNHFGEYEADSVFVRNDAMRTDYEILRDVRRYSDIT
jgi:hypothetical protein